jgi:alkylation response protein AidB-like acyl-CoA dehydrogenase
MSTPAATVADKVDFLAVVDSIAPELESLGDQIEATSVIPAAVREILTREGLLRMTLPVEYGGHGLCAEEYLPVLERVAGFHGAIRMFVHGMNGLWRPMFNFGTQEQRDRWLPVHQAGGLFAFALTETDTGTGRDVGTTATWDHDQWVIRGRKNLISWAGDAEVQYVVAATGVGPDGKREISCILVPKDAPGMTCTRIPDGMGCRGSRHDVVVYDGVRVPAANLLGARGQGLEVGVRGFLDVSRVGIATSALGAAQRMFDLACEYAKSRVTFGRPISARQAIQMQTGEMAADLFALRSAIMTTARLYDQGEPIVTEAAMCKLLGIDVSARVSDRALRIHGGIGYTGAYRIERIYRDIRALWFEEGTAEIQKLVASRPFL